MRVIRRTPPQRAGTCRKNTMARRTTTIPSSRFPHPHSSSRRPLKWLTIRTREPHPAPKPRQHVFQRPLLATRPLPVSPPHQSQSVPFRLQLPRHYRHGHHSPNLSPHVPHRTPAAAAGIVAPERFVCQICKKSFSRSHDRKRHHVGQHLDSHARPVCPNCHKDFSRYVW